MKYSFQKYSDPHWGYWRSFAGCYVPDEIFEPALDALKENAAQTLKYAPKINQENRQATPQQKWNWPDSLDFVAGCWTDLGSEYSSKIQSAFSNGSLKITDVAPGNGAGRCPGAYIEFERDGTLNDPVYMAHESGHLIAVLMALNSKDSHPQSNIAEIQAFFMQEKAYDRLRQKAKTPEEDRAIRLHRLANYTGCLCSIPFCLWTINQQKDAAGHTKTLQSSFSEWAIEDKECIARYQKWFDDENEPAAFKAQRLHTHPFAALLTVGLYKKYQAASPNAQKYMIKTLYEGGAETALQDILNVFGIQNQIDLKQAASHTMHDLAEEISQCGLITAHSASPLKINV